MEEILPGLSPTISGNRGNGGTLSLKWCKISPFDKILLLKANTGEAAFRLAQKGP